MDPVIEVRGKAAAIRRSNIDTDQIVPAYWMKRVQRFGYEDGLFENFRKDPNFILNQPERSDVSIIIGGENFGCGSSRQHAVWALRDYGIRAVISPEIADIHRTNLPIEGLVPVELDRPHVEALMDATDIDPEVEVVIDVKSKTVTCFAAGLVGVPFNIDTESHHNLVHGHDPIDVTMALEMQVTEHERAQPAWLPVCGPQFSTV